MKRLLIALYLLLVLLLAATTVVEHFQGTEYVERSVYHTTWFCCLWGALALLSVAWLVRRRMWRRLPTLLLHGSFLVILAGAMITFLYGRKGYLHLREGMSDSTFFEREGSRPHTLPFVLRLDSFRIEHYPGTEAPADYISYLTCMPRKGVGESGGFQVRVSMNRIFSYQGYRFYQSSYDESGSWLTVNHDPWGTGVTYAGYLLLGCSMLLLLLVRSGGFRRLLRHPLLRRGGWMLVLAVWGLPAYTRTSLPAVVRHQADSLARQQVIYQDRVVPFNTLARDFVKKLTGRDSYGGLTAEQVVLGWLLAPEAWREEPMIYIKSAELRERLGLKTSRVRLVDLFDGDRYRLQGLYTPQDAFSAGKPSPLQKAVLEADEKVGLILMLHNGTLIRPLPTDGSVAPLPERKVEAELLYNRIPFSKILFMFNLTVGLLLFLLLLFRRLCGKTALVAAFLLYASFCFHLFGYALRWYIAGRIPLSNGYETMQFLALSILLLACLFRRRFPFTLPFGFLLSGFALLVAYLGEMNPQITPLMPVLVSPWLSSHVSLIMMAYALLAFTWLDALLALFRPAERLRLMLFSRLLLYPAVFFLGAGIFLGAVWANVSWGRYWAWDPKEVWALVAFLIYGAAFHAESLPLFRRPLAFHLYMLVAFLAVLMTYFGVNYLLGGMHSYAG